MNILLLFMIHKSYSFKIMRNNISILKSCVICKYIIWTWCARFGKILLLVGICLQVQIIFLFSFIRFYVDIKQQIRLIEKGVLLKDSRFIQRVVRSLTTIRKRLNNSVLRRLVNIYVSQPNFASRDSLLKVANELFGFQIVCFSFQIVVKF